MNCKEFRQIYTDSGVGEDVSHTDYCSDCRDFLLQTESLRAMLGQMSRPVLDMRQQRTIVEALESRAESNIFGDAILRTETVLEWIKNRAMPVAAGAFATLFIGFALVSTMLTPPNKVESEDFALRDATILHFDKAELEQIVSPEDFARSRTSVAAVSPSINPKGAIIALSRSLFSDEMRNEDIVVVANVFGDGFAKIDNFIEAPEDKRKAEAVVEALEKSKDSPPFVDSIKDGRGDNVRIVLRFENVTVHTK